MLKIVNPRKQFHQLNRLFRRSCAWALVFAPLSHGDPWANAGESQTRFHIQVLADSGKIKHPITSWPVMWVDIEGSLIDVDVKRLNDRELWSYRYLKHSIDRARRSLSGEKKAYIGSSRSAVTDFASPSRERAELSSSISATLYRTAFKLRAVTFENLEDEVIIRYDGSYLASTLGNWVLGVGAIDKWWGPGWQSSLILSNNARPSPGLFLQRKQADAFSWPVLSLLGPWNIHLFANQLEKKRQVPNAKFLGGRMTFRPLSFLEVGLSRTAQWGGEGQTESLESLSEVILGNDDESDQGRANQVFSYDWRLHLPFIKGFDIAIYYQQMSEGNDGLSARNADTWGIEASFLTGPVNTHLSFENYDSRNPPQHGVYEHSTYLTGYRTQGRNIGASLDTSSLGQSLLVEHYFSNGHQLNWRYGEIDFNIDNVSQEFGGHSYGNNHVEETLIEIRYKFPLSKKLQVQAGLQHLSDTLNYYGEVIESNLSLGFEYQW